MKGQQKQKGKGKGEVATLDPEVESPSTVEETQSAPEETLVGTVEVTETVQPSTTPEFGNARIVESPTAESPVAVAETTDGEPKIKSAAQKKWREKNKEKVQAYQKKWRAGHKEKVKEIHTNYRKKNPEKVKGWQKASQERRKTKAAEEKAATAAANPTETQA